MHRRLLYLASLVYGLSVLGALAACYSSSPQATEPPPQAPAAPLQGPPAAMAISGSESPGRPAELQLEPSPVARPIIGFAINFHHTDHLELYLQAIDEMARLGFNT